jgi:TrkA domain protein
MSMLPRTPARAIQGVEECSLPGVGHRFDLATDDGWKVVVVVHHTGRRDLYVLGRGEQEPRASVTLSDRQARVLGAIVGGSYFQPAAVERVEEVVGGLLIDWLPLEAGAPAAGRSLESLEIRARTGMTIVAILRGDDAIVTPEPTEVLQVGDVLVIAGKRADRARFVGEVLGRSDG